MCGRFAVYSTIEELAELIREALPDLEIEQARGFVPSYNIAPSAAIVTIGRSRPEHPHRMALLKWGLVPSFAKDPTRMAPINVRSETVLTKPMFRRPIERQRCLVPANGFFEWKRAGSRKQPYFIRRADGRPLLMAGIYDVWRGGEGGAPLMTCAILTTDSNDWMKPLHHRMPVMVAPEAAARWCDPQRPAADVLPLLTPPPADALEAYPVDARMNSPRHDDPACIAPLPPAPDVPGDKVDPEQR